MCTHKLHNISHITYYCVIGNVRYRYCKQIESHDFPQ